MDVRGVCGICGCGNGGAAMIMIIYIKNECNKKEKSCVLLLLCFADLLPQPHIDALASSGRPHKRARLIGCSPHASAALKEGTYPTHKVTQTAFVMHSRRNFHAHYVAKDIYTVRRRILAEKRRPVRIFRERR